jgi:site-specific DNA-methyltransferase (adenine-specific)
MNYIKLKNGKKWPLNTAYEGDCLDFMKELPDKCIDLVLTDPPYGIGGKFKGGESGKMNFNSIVAKWWDIKPDKEIFNEMFRISKHQIIWGGNYFSLPPSRCFIVWDKLLSEDFSLSMGEYAWTSFDKIAKLYKQSTEKIDRIHPTQKPLKLFKWCLEKYAPENAIVFDPFLGSFTTAVACHSHGLNWIGCEKDADYFNAGMERYETECLQNLLEF